MKNNRANYHVRGRIKGEKRGGVFFGISMDTHEPAFGAGKLIHAPVLWMATRAQVQKICDEIMKEYPMCEAYPSEIKYK